MFFSFCFPRLFGLSLSLIVAFNCFQPLTKNFSFSFSFSFSTQSHRQRVLPPRGQRPLRRLPLPGGRRPRPRLHAQQLLLGRQRPARDGDRRRHLPRAVAVLPAAVGLRRGGGGALHPEGQGRGGLGPDAGGLGRLGLPGGCLRGQDQGVCARKFEFLFPILFFEVEGVRVVDENKKNSEKNFSSPFLLPVFLLPNNNEKNSTGSPPGPTATPAGAAPRPATSSATAAARSAPASATGPPSECRTRRPPARAARPPATPSPPS